MAYTDFTLDAVTKILGISVEPADLFPSIDPAPIPAWLKDSLDRGRRQALVSEKARSEFLVVPILLATQEFRDPLAIYSGQRLDVDPQQGLMGECDFILAATAPLPSLRAPLLTVVEAKKNDVENGIGQCFAQMAGARLFNERAGAALDDMYGCVTTGETWQFLRLEGTLGQMDRSRYYIDNVALILAVLRSIVSRPA